jgi:hypothetical protein
MDAAEVNAAEVNAAECILPLPSESSYAGFILGLPTASVSDPAIKVII